MFRHILVATDGSELSGRAVDMAISLAKGLGAKLTAIHAAELAAPSDMSFLSELPQERETPGMRQAHEIARKVESLARDAGIECEVIIENDAPWKAVVRVAEERRCDLIVMATHGRHGVNAVLIGSETQEVLAHAKMPVLACR